MNDLSRHISEVTDPESGPLADDSRESADYSTTIVYKIIQKDSVSVTPAEDSNHVSSPSPPLLYVGHTTDFVKRRYQHKKCSINPNAPGYNCKLYKTIREHGGWDNWKMEIVTWFNCSNLYEARQKEQEYFISLKANMNSVDPLPTPVNLPTYENINSIEYSSNFDKYQNAKYLFDQQVNPLLPFEERAYLFDNYYIDRSNRFIYDNIKSESESFSGTMVSEMNLMTEEKLSYIAHINKLLGLENSFTNEVRVERKQFEDLMPYLFKEMANISVTFALRDQSKKEKKQDFESTLKFVNKLYNSWNGTKFKGMDLDRTKKPAYYETNVEIKDNTVPLFLNSFAAATEFSRSPTLALRLAPNKCII